MYVYLYKSIWFYFFFLILIFPRILQDALLLSDSRLHLFLQTQLSPEDMEACVSGQTKYSVADAIHKFASLNRRFPVEDEERKQGKNDADSDSDRWFLLFLTFRDYIYVHTHAHASLFCWCNTKIMKKLIDWDFIELWQLIIEVFTHTSTLN